MAFPRAARMPWLLPAASPRLSGLAMTRAQGARSRTASTLPSLEALSTTIASHDMTGGWSAIDARQSSKASREFQLTMTTEISGSALTAWRSARLVATSEDVARGSVARALALAVRVALPGPVPLAVSVRKVG